MNNTLSTVLITNVSCYFVLDKTLTGIEVVCDSNIKNFSVHKTRGPMVLSTFLSFNKLFSPKQNLQKFILFFFPPSITQIFLK